MRIITVFIEHIIQGKIQPVFESHVCRQGEAVLPSYQIIAYVKVTNDKRCGKRRHYFNYMQWNAQKISDGKERNVNQADIGNGGF